MAEDIGAIFNTKMPGYEEAADIQAALKLYHYGSSAYDVDNLDTSLLPSPSIAFHLQTITDDILDLQALGLGSIVSSSEPTANIADGYIWLDPTTDAQVYTENLVAHTSTTEPTTNLTTGYLWVDISTTPYELKVYDDNSSAFVEVRGMAPSSGDSLYLDYNTGTNDLQNIDDGVALKHSDGTTDLEGSITVSSGFTRSMIELHGRISPVTTDGEDTYLMVQRSTDGGSTWSDVQNVQTSSIENDNAGNFVSLWKPFTIKVLDTHGVAAGSSVSYRFINNTATVNGTSANTIRQWFDNTSSLLIVQEVA